jgi:sugar phosphate isomerase/epimerase
MCYALFHARQSGERLMDELRIGLCWGTIHKADLPETIEIAARHGFPTIAIPPDLYFASRDAGLGEQALRRKLADAGVKVRVIDAITSDLPGLPAGSTDFRGRQMMRANAETCLAVAEALEAPIVNVSYFRSEPVALTAIAEGIGAVCRQAARRGVEIVLEFVPDSGIATLAAAHAIARDCGEPNCGILLDTWHLARSGGTVADVEALPPGAIGAFQLSDRVEPPPGTPYVPMTGRKLPGEGELPLAAIVAAALANSPGITAEIEVFSEELNGLSPDAAAARTAAALAAWRASLAR